MQLVPTSVWRLNAYLIEIILFFVKKKSVHELVVVDTVAARARYTGFCLRGQNNQYENIK